MLQRRNAPSLDSHAPAQGASPDLGVAPLDLGSNAAARETLAASAGSGLNDQALKTASDAAVAKAPSEMREGARGVIPVILRQAATSNIRNVNQVDDNCAHGSQDEDRRERHERPPPGS